MFRETIQHDQIIVSFRDGLTIYYILLQSKHKRCMRK